MSRETVGRGYEVKEASGDPGVVQGHEVAWWFCSLLLPLIALSPLLWMQGAVLMGKPHMQFFPLVILGAVYFLRTESEPFVSRSSRGWVQWLWLGGCVVAGVALFLGSPWLAQCCMTGMVGVWALGARPHFSVLRITGIVGLLSVALPPPFGLDHRLVQGLQSLSSMVCSRLMDCAGIVHVRRGNIIEIASKPLFVEEACSGVDSQYALMAVAGVLLLLGRAGWIVSLITIVTVPLWAILGNLLRIFLIVGGLEWFGVDLSQGQVHTVLGLMVFAFTAWVHWSSVQFLNYLQVQFFSQSKESGGEEGLERRLVGDQGHRMRWEWVFVPLLLFVFFPDSVQSLIDFHRAPDLPSMTREQADRFPGRGALAVGSGGRVLGFQTEYRDRDDMLGQHSRIWEVASGVGRMTVCLDFPFRGWHPLWECYINSGWKRLSSQMLEGQDGNGAFYETILENDLGDKAVLHFSLFDEEARPYTFEGSVAFRQHAARWKNTLWNRKGRIDRGIEPLTFQYQQLAHTNIDPTQEDLVELRGMFLVGRRQVVAQSQGVLREFRGAEGGEK
jgi:exosortase